VAPGQTASFTLEYGNSGGFENDAWVRTDFPPEAPFASSIPEPVEVGEDGRTAWWNLGELAADDAGTITVTVGVTEVVPFSTTILIWNGIFNHVFDLQDETFVEYEIPPANLFLPLVLRDS
jgi:hypothetical protein